MWQGVPEAAVETDRFLLSLPLIFAALLGLLKMILPLGGYQLTQIPADSAFAGLGWDVWAATQVIRSDKFIASDHAAIWMIIIAIVHFILFALFAQLGHRANAWRLVPCSAPACSARYEPSAGYCASCGKQTERSAKAPLRALVFALVLLGSPTAIVLSFAAPFMITAGYGLP